MMFALGIEMAMRKHASMDQVVSDVVDASIAGYHDGDLSEDDDLEDLLPGKGQLESVVATVEDNFDVILPADVVFGLFAEGTVGDLKMAVVRALIMQKTAADHAYYMRNRTKIKQRQRQYRMRNLHRLRRKAKIYRRRVARRQIRPRRRMGSAAGGYTFIQR